MILNIAGEFFNTDEFEDIFHREEIKTVFITTSTYGCQRIEYDSLEEIQDLVMWERLQTITNKDVFQAMYTLIMVCEYYVNSKTQCIECPLQNELGCMLNTIPINWR